MRFTRNIVIRIAAAAAVCLLSTSLFAQSSDPDLIGLFTFGYPSTVQGSPTMVTYGQLTGNALAFNDPVVGPAATFVDGSASFIVPEGGLLHPRYGTVSIWVNPSQLQNADLIATTTDRAVRRDTPWSMLVYGLRLTDDGSVVGIIDNDDVDGPWTWAWSLDHIYQPGQWYLITMTWDGTFCSLYLNDQLEITTRYNEIPDLGLSYSGEYPMHIGNSFSWPGATEFVGSLGEARVYSRALTAEEVTALYQEKFPSLAPAVDDSGTPLNGDLELGRNSQQRQTSVPTARVKRAPAGGTKKK